MNYEKEYKEALSRATFVKENTDSIGAKDVSDVIEYIFSELKESEDERIIKWIRKELESKYVVENIATNIYADKALAWLEKQRELQWKPSEEQMQALAEALSLAKNCGEESAFDLRTLYEHLKKLKDK